jgi:hypothetical protein
VHGRASAFKSHPTWVGYELPIEIVAAAQFVSQKGLKKAEIDISATLPIAINIGAVDVLKGQLPSMPPSL